MRSLASRGYSSTPEIKTGFRLLRTVPHGVPLALVGCGRWGRHVLRDLVALQCDVSVVALSGATRAFALAHGATRASADLDALSPDIAAAVVATPAATHAAVVEQLLERGIPVFCEKPLVTNGEDARRLARAAGGRLFVMDKWRYHPGIERMAEVRRSGELGRPLGLRTARLQPGRVHQDIDPVWTLAPHDLSIALEILGDIPEPQSAVGERDGDQLLGLAAILGTDPWFTFEVSATHPDYRREARLICEAGSVSLLGGAIDVLHVVRRGADGVEQWPVSGELPLMRELRAFLEYVNGGPSPRSSVGDAVRSVEVLEALHHMAKQGRT
ncbi:MAG: Gfo/Idh/MocA family protein [Vicinamibacterales bacterium]